MTKPSPELPPSSETVPAIPTVSSRDLFGDHKEIHITHQTETYRLRITSRGKLILQK